jgi:hypothetical protein
MVTDSIPLCVIVHPGSLCGSADFDLGREGGDSLRKAVLADLASLSGHVLVIHGELSDEIADYPDLFEGLQAMRARIKGERHSYTSITACALGAEDWEQDVAAALAKLLKRIGHLPPCLITGAWFYGDGNGCVEAVAEIATQAGLTPKILPGAMSQIVPGQASGQTG